MSRLQFDGRVGLDLEVVGGLHVASGVDASHIPRLSLVVLGQLVPNGLQLLAVTTPGRVESYDPFALLGVFDDSRKERSR